MKIRYGVTGSHSRTISWDGFLIFNSVCQDAARPHAGQCHNPNSIHEILPLESLVRVVTDYHVQIGKTASMWPNTHAFSTGSDSHLCDFPGFKSSFQIQAHVVCQNICAWTILKTQIMCRCLRAWVCFTVYPKVKVNI